MARLPPRRNHLKSSGCGIVHRLPSSKEMVCFWKYKADIEKWEVIPNSALPVPLYSFKVAYQDLNLHNYWWTLGRRSITRSKAQIIGSKRWKAHWAIPLASAFTSPCSSFCAIPETVHGMSVLPWPIHCLEWEVTGMPLLLGTLVQGICGAHLSVICILTAPSRLLGP
jgi:hypothetical protein